MKTFLVLAMIAGATTAQANNSALAGLYVIHSTDCIVGGVPQDAVMPMQLKVEADDSGVSSVMPIHTKYSRDGLGDMTIHNLPEGDYTRIMFGGSEYRTLGEFSRDGEKFEYREFDNQAQGLPMNELRGTSYELIHSDVLTITQTGDGLEPRVCQLSRVK
ncbi:MAG: hypothetical protein ACXWQO_16895 [Bdellovibrionota bacterium]